MTSIFTVIGARPQFIKAAVLSRAFRSQEPNIKELLVHTGQHYDSNMSAVFFEALDIPRPAHQLGIGGGSHGQNTGRMLEHLEALMLMEKPDWVLVYGDTDSTLAGALAASKLHIPVAHVEAGLRSFNRRMPEELNRILTDHLSSVLFVPTSTAVRHLAKEGICGASVRIVGDIMYDAALFYKARARPPSGSLLADLQPEAFVLCTVHRAENTDDPITLRQIFDGLGASPVPVILPIHPRTRSRMTQMGLTTPPNIHLIDPVGYLEMVWLEMNCRLIITDSGGVQKEAYFHGKPCVTLRNETEWTELVELGVNYLVGVDPEAIARAITNAMVTNLFFPNHIYGDGSCAAQILKFFNE